MTNDTGFNPSRRQIVGGLATGLAAAVAAPAMAQTATPASGTAPGERSPLLTKQDPLTQYPKPPFERQPQEAPGLASRMVPRPDHGETSYRGSGRLEGRKALITGGDSGIGRAAAIAYAREGADVAIGYLPVEEEDAREVIALIEAEGRKAVALPGDISDEAFCREMVERAVTELGGLDILVNNAGKQVAVAQIADLSDEQFELTFRTNVFANFWITKAALAHMSAGASIINTASLEAYKPSPERLDYAATKAAINNFSKGLAQQVAARGIRVNVVAPGPVWTALQVSGGVSDEQMKAFDDENIYQRSGQPAELAPAYVFLASAESSYVSGETLNVNGGMVTP